MSGRSVASAHEQLTGLKLRPEAAPLIERLAADVPDIGQRAYILATVQHETADTWRPISERHDGPNRVAYFEARYGVGSRLAARLRNTKPGDGALFHGRGYVQLTGRWNYRVLSSAIARAGVTVDLEARPDLACEPDVAYHVLRLGMLLGLFTGLPLSRYVTATRRDYWLARKVVNGLDRAEHIAALAVAWQRAIEAGGEA